MYIFPLTYIVKNRMKEKEASTLKYREGYIKSKQKYAQLRENIDEMLLKKSEELRQGGGLSP